MKCLLMLQSKANKKPPFGQLLIPITPHEKCPTSVVYSVPHSLDQPLMLQMSEMSGKEIGTLYGYVDGP